MIPAAFVVEHNRLIEDSSSSILILVFERVSDDRWNENKQICAFVCCTDFPFFLLSSFPLLLFICMCEVFFSFSFFLSWRFGTWDPRSISILEKRRLDSFQ